MTHIASLDKKSAWKTALSLLVTDPHELLAMLNLRSEQVELSEKALQSFSLKVPLSFVARMEKGNPNDPLLRQVLPTLAELTTVPGYVVDPLQEKKKNPVPGLLHKYKGRVLVTFSPACAVHCRYCFRRNFPYSDNIPGKEGFTKIIDYVRKEPSIREVILSGGDPLVANEQLLKDFSDQLATIPHVKLLRIHTRLPVVLPERITDEFLAWIDGLKLQLIIVIHANHANEINEEVAINLQKLAKHKATLLNQSVLLKGVNDNVQTLAQLSETLFSAGVLPYYLHVLDKVQGTAHFDMELDKAKQLHAELNKALPGYLVPRLVCEQSGELSKTFLG